MIYLILVPVAVIAILIPIVIVKAAASREKSLSADLLTQEKEKQYAEAVRTVRKLIGMRPKFAEYYADLARVQEKMGRLKDARNTFQEMLEAGIHSFTWSKERVSENIIRLCLALKDHPEAFKVSWMLWKYKPESAAAHAGLGRVYAGQGRLDEAKQHLGEAVRLAPDFADGRFYYALCLLDWGDSKSAVEHLEKAFELNPSDRNVIFFLGALYAQIGRNDRAAQLLSKIGVGPESVPQKLVRVGILSQEVPRLDLEFLKGKSAELKKSGRIRTVEELLGTSGEELHEAVLKILGKMKMSVKEEIKSADSGSEKRFLCENEDGAAVLVVFVKTRTELGPIPLTEIQNQMETRGVSKAILLLTSELSAAARRYSGKDGALTVIDRTKLGKYL